MYATCHHAHADKSHVCTHGTEDLLLAAAYVGELDLSTLDIDSMLLFFLLQIDQQGSNSQLKLDVINHLF